MKLIIKGKTYRANYIRIKIRHCLNVPNRGRPSVWTVEWDRSSFLSWEELFIGDLAEESVSNVLDDKLQSLLNGGHKLFDDVRPVVV